MVPAAEKCWRLEAARVIKPHILIMERIIGDSLLAAKYIIYKYFYSLAAVGVYIIIFATGPHFPPRNQDLPSYSVVVM